jgi:hypothetical protein
MIPLWKGKNPVYVGVKGQGHCYYEYNFWLQDRFRTITLVLYIGSLPNLATWFLCGRGRTLFILGSLPLYRLIIYMDGRILWCTDFLLSFVHTTLDNYVFSSPGHRPCELLSWVSVRRPSVSFSHLNLLLWHRWTDFNQTCQKCSLDGPLPDLCFWCWFEIQHGCQGP